MMDRYQNPQVHAAAGHQHRSPSTGSPGAHVGNGSNSTVPPVVWDTVANLLHASDPRDTILALYALVDLIRAHGLQGIPPLTDTQIERVWDTIRRSSMIQSLRDWDRCHLVALLFAHASDAQRRAWWDTFQRSLPSEPDAVIAALQWGVPLWMIPEGREALRNAGITDPGRALPTLSNTLMILSSEISGVHTGPLADVLFQLPVAELGEGKRAWIAMVRFILTDHPDMFFQNQVVSDRVFTACGIPEMAGDALCIIETLQPMTHPQLLPTLEQMIHTSDDRIVRKQAVMLWMDALYRNGYTTEDVQKIVHSAWNTAGNRTAPDTDRTVAEAIVAMGIQRPELAPVLRPYLQDLARSDAEIAPWIIHTVLSSRYDDSITCEMIDLAERILGTPTYRDAHDTALRMLYRAWGKGHDDRILAIIQPLAQSYPAPDAIIYALSPGVYRPQIGPQILSLIESVDPGHADRNLLRAVEISRWLRQPLPPAVVEAVIQACERHPRTVTDPVMDALWDSGPHAFHTALGQLWRNEMARATVIRSFRNGWNRLSDPEMNSLIDMVTSDRTLMSDYTTVQAIADVIVSGINTGNLRTIMTAWENLVYRTPDHARDAIFTTLSARRDLWQQAPVSHVCAMYHTFYHSHEPSDRVMVATGIFPSIARGWGNGNDEAVCRLINTILDDIMRQSYPPLVEYALIMTRQCMGALRFGWGRVDTQTIAGMIQNVLAWLDDRYRGWDTTKPGHDTIPTIVQAVIAGGGQPMLVIPNDIGDIGRPLPPGTLDRIRSILARL